LTRENIKARGACYYYKDEGHIIRQCHKKHIDRLEKKYAKQDSRNNSEDQPVYIR
jgi:DNA replication protein DnaC